MATLYIIATPIGNLSDMSERVKESLVKSDIVFAEDTRVAKKLLSHLGLKKDVVRFDDHATEKEASVLASRITSASFVSDAGTPNISDPGWLLVDAALKKGVEVVSVPGPSALTAALSLAHFPISSFIFHGFPPQKKGRETFFKNIEEQKISHVLFESPHRIEKTLISLSDTIEHREMLVVKELTKFHERTWRGSARDIEQEFGMLSEEEKKGEFVIVIAPKKYGRK